ncbi:MAG: hypothetical protein HQL10_14040 [Nitrospirae bacterium]|nr:hypothetical protein [Nitrospirota bacterium]
MIEEEKENKTAKLRRFALTMNLIVIVYIFAGAEISSQDKLTVSGLPLVGGSGEAPNLELEEPNTALSVPCRA